MNKYKSTKRTWDEVKKIGQDFEKKYKSEINQIIKIIPGLVGNPWRSEITEVYIVDWIGPSFSHPLTLKVKEDLLLMLVILTHELLHSFYLDEKDIEKVEEVINNKVKQVFEKLNINAVEQLKISKAFTVKDLERRNNFNYE